MAYQEVERDTSKQPKADWERDRLLLYIPLKGKPSEEWRRYVTEERIKKSINFYIGGADETYVAVREDVLIVELNPDSFDPDKTDEDELQKRIDRVMEQIDTYMRETNDRLKGGHELSERQEKWERERGLKDQERKQRTIDVLNRPRNKPSEK